MSYAGSFSKKVEFQTETTDLVVLVITFVTWRFVICLLILGTFSSVLGSSVWTKDLVFEEMNSELMVAISYLYYLTCEIVASRTRVDIVNIRRFANDIVNIRN